jgi:hypothetical protein
MCPGARTQPGRIWQARYDQFMRGQKFTQSIVDCRVFYLRLSDGKLFVVGVYVDDNWIICDDDSTCDECYATWKPEFDESENVVQAADDFCGIRTKDLPCGAIALSSTKLLLALYEMIEEYPCPIHVPRNAHAPRLALEDARCRGSRSRKSVRSWALDCLSCAGRVLTACYRV